MKIKTSVKFNSGKAYVLDKNPEFKCYRLGTNIIYATDGIFYKCYKYEGGSKAFGGRKFTLQIEDTKELVECSGQWYDGGYGILNKELGLNLVNITYNTDEDLKKCYVFSGATVDNNTFELILEESGELFYHDYYDYEKILRYDDLRNKSYYKERNLERHKKSLIKQCKRLAERLKPFKNQILINKL